MAITSKYNIKVEFIRQEKEQQEAYDCHLKKKQIMMNYICYLEVCGGECDLNDSFHRDISLGSESEGVGRAFCSVKRESCDGVKHDFARCERIAKREGEKVGLLHDYIRDIRCFDIINDLD